MSDGCDTGDSRAQQRATAPNGVPERPDVGPEQGKGINPVPPQPDDPGTDTGRHAATTPEETTAAPPTEVPQQVNQQPVDPESVGAQREPRTSDDLSAAEVLRPAKPPPSSGWRKFLYLASFKLINIGESPRVAQRNSLAARVNRPLAGCYRIALLSLKGGVGKTTITATLGGTFASLRGDRVVAVDANPHRGTLSAKVPAETVATVRHLLRDADRIGSYMDMRRYTSQGSSRLEVLASEDDPAVSHAFNAEDYTRTLNILERFYNLVLTDCGTGLMHSAMSAVLAKADVLVVVASGSVDGALSAAATLDWLDAHGHEDMVRNSIAVINAVRPPSGKVDMQKIVGHFAGRCRAVRLMPFDPHLETGAEISLDELNRQTREALIDLAAVVADGFPGADTQESSRARTTVDGGEETPRGSASQSFSEHRH